MQTQPIVSTFVVVSALSLAPMAEADSTPGAGPTPTPSTIRVVVDSRGFAPGSIEVQKGRADTFEFVRTTDSTCAKQIVVPALSIRKPLPLNTPADISIPANEPKAFAFACGMGMFNGTVIVR